MDKVLILILVSTFLSIEALAQNPDPLVFQNRIIDLGPVPVSKKDTVVLFQYQNEGDVPLSIVGMFPGCPCMTVSFSTDPLMPEEMSSFSVNYHFSNTDSGPFYKAITITYSVQNSTDLKIIRVGIKGEAVKE